MKIGIAKFLCRFVEIMLLFALIVATSASAETYKYQDEYGHWRYTDRPQSGSSQQPVEVLPTPAAKSRPTQDLNAWLRAKFSPQTPIQEATLSTVTIKTPVGTGSGFFISDSGYILTNKHVVKLPEKTKKEIEQNFGDAEQKLDYYRKRLAWRERELEKYEKELARYETYLQGLPEGATKADKQSYYQFKQSQYRTLQQELSSDRRKFQEIESEVTAKQREFDWKSAVSGAASTFTVVLKDGTELTAYLVAVSEDHDLALLKIDQHRTPFLRPAIYQDISQGIPVYAIGSPLGLRDSVSNGVVSGIEPIFIRTDAKIYPGNSGGPLVLSDGRVIGINTMKRITYGLEGIGYAINISTALQEFAGYLSR